MKKIFIAFLISLFGSAVLAQTVTIGTNQAYLMWTIPTTNTDGTPVTNLAGFDIYYGANPSSMTNIINVPNPSQAGYMVSNLANGTWYFVVTAYTTTGTQNVPSNVVEKAIPGPIKTISTVIPSPPTNLTLTAQ